MIITRIQAADFDPGAELAALDALGGGAVASFTGLVRGEGGLAELRLDHYPGMADRMLAETATEAAARWPLAGATVIHRVGVLAAGARIVFVGTASRHRAAALDACTFLIDRLKTEAPFWKQERFADGRLAWIDARDADAAAAARWARDG